MEIETGEGGRDVCGVSTGSEWLMASRAGAGRWTSLSEERAKRGDLARAGTWKDRTEAEHMSQRRARATSAQESDLDLPLEPLERHSTCWKLLHLHLEGRLFRKEYS